PFYYGTRASGACVGADIGTTISDTVQVQVGCSGVTLTDILTRMSRGSIIQNLTNPVQYSMQVTWTPTSSQWGTNLACYTPVDSIGQQGTTVCITYLVGISAPQMIQSSYVNGTMSAIGTLYQNQNVWRVQCTKSVNRPSIDAYIRFYKKSNNTQVYSINARTDMANVLYDNFTLIFYTSMTWTPVICSS
ncbi:unnamed protein product, partial [Didymodactylos carnosus]